MKTLTVLLFNFKEQKISDSIVVEFGEAYEHYNFVTETYESNKFMMVQEIKVDTNTIVREFATVKDGHLFDLILCGGIAESVSVCSDMHNKFR